MFLSRVKQLTKCDWNRTNPLSGLCPVDKYFNVKYILYTVYEIIHICTAVVDESEERFF